MNDNREIFEVPGVYENPRRQTLNSLCNMSEIHKFGGVRLHIYQRFILCGQLAGINLDSWTLDKLLFTNLIFLASKLEVPMINKKISFLQARKLKKWLNLKENNKTICILADEKLAEVNNNMLIIELLTEATHFCVISNYLRNLRSNPFSLNM